jgi:type IV pilus assembly protein PilE
MKANSGFTLIEVISVIAIISILAAIAVPNYIDYLTKGRITEAVGALASMQVRMQQHFLDERTYVGACAAGTVAPLPTNTSNFTFACSGLGAAAYQVDATGQEQHGGLSIPDQHAYGGWQEHGCPAEWLDAPEPPSTCFVAE